MSGPKKRGKQSVQDSQMEIAEESEIEQFADIISENILGRNTCEIDPFELYAHQLRVHFHSNTHLFKERFSEGYRILLEELTREPIS